MTRDLVPAHTFPCQTAPGRGAPYPVGEKTAQAVVMMAWVILVFSGVLEAVWATALSRSDGFTRTGPTVVFLAALVVSMVGLAVAMRDLPVGTAYAVWVGIGAALTAGYAMIWGGEPFSLIRVLLLIGIVGCVIGLKLVSP